MGSTIRLDGERARDRRTGARSRAVLAAGGGTAFGLWLGLAASGLPPATLAVCSVIVLTGIAWLGRGLETTPRAVSFWAACGVGTGWVACAAGSARTGEGALFALLLAALIFSLTVEARAAEDRTLGAS